MSDVTEAIMKEVEADPLIKATGILLGVWSQSGSSNRRRPCTFAVRSVH